MRIAVGAGASHAKRGPSIGFVTTGDLALLRGLLLHSDMLRALTAHQLQYEMEADSLTVLPFEMKGIVRGIGITTRAGAHLSPGAVALLAEVRRLSSLHGSIPGPIAK